MYNADTNSDQLECKQNNIYLLIGGQQIKLNDQIITCKYVFTFSSKRFRKMDYFHTNFKKFIVEKDVMKKML